MGPLAVLLLAQLIPTCSVNGAVVPCEPATPIKDSIPKVIAEMAPSDEQRLTALEELFAQEQKNRTEEWKCLSRAMIGAGADLMSTASALAKCPGCREANPLGFNTEARVALKFSQLGATVATCRILNNKGHTTAAKWASWSSLIAQLLFSANNLVHTFRGQ